MVGDPIDSAGYWDRRPLQSAAGRRPSGADRATLDAVPPGPAVLELGCGPGVFTAQGVERQPPGGCWTAADVSSVFCAITERRLPGIRVLCADLRELDLPAHAFDTIYAMATLHHLPPDATVQVLRAVSGWLTPAGRFALLEEWAFEPATPARQRLLDLRRALARARGDGEVHPTEAQWMERLDQAGMEVLQHAHVDRPLDLGRYDGLPGERDRARLAWLRARGVDTVPMSLFACGRSDR